MSTRASGYKFAICTFGLEIWRRFLTIWSPPQTLSNIWESKNKTNTQTNKKTTSINALKTILQILQIILIKDDSQMQVQSSLSLGVVSNHLECIPVAQGSKTKAASLSPTPAPTQLHQKRHVLEPMVGGGTWVQMRSKYNKKFFLLTFTYTLGLPRAAESRRGACPVQDAWLGPPLPKFSYRPDATLSQPRSPGNLGPGDFVSLPHLSSGPRVTYGSL